MITDDTVIERVRSGDTSAFAILVERYNRRILGFIFRMINDQDEAENLAQDVFIKVYEKIGDYRTEDNFQAYIYRIAKNMTLNYIKKSSRSSPFSTLFRKTDEDSRFMSKGEQENLLLSEKRGEWINTALRELPENQRLALILKVYLQLSYVEIADITGWTISKIETLISRGRTGLKNKYKMQEKIAGNVL